MLRCLKAGRWSPENIAYRVLSSQASMDTQAALAPSGTLRRREEQAEGYCLL